ncbi:MAG: hypothetical protein JO093_24600 [Acidobacteria bacterium]|nr:hypothetical protein [Acidobacteriota bacterium]MBV9071871.1 hypothetical protein [Acidobacteriota bacterium]MBV9188809.1 hypothetical protein [Acidobacteriota bacterium]
MNPPAAFDAFAILDLLHRREVKFVVIGGIAGNLLGSDILTNDLDICFARDLQNTRRLASALNEIHARLRNFPTDLPFVVDEHALRLGETFTFETDFGHFDCLGNPSGTDGYVQLRNGAECLEVNGVMTYVASLPDLIRMKEAADREKDRWALVTLRAMLKLRG